MGSDWGRIDASGTVYVRTADGERAVGSWQARDPDAGLAHFELRFEDLATEAMLLQQRLDSGAADPRSTRTHALALKQQLPTASAIGDFASLDALLDAVIAAADIKMVQRAAERERARTEGIAAKEALIAEAEQLATAGNHWKAAGDRLRAIPDEWKLIKGIDSKTDDALWKRFAAARDGFTARRGAHFAQLDADRAQAKAIKERLVAQAEELSASQDWRGTADALKGLMRDWKAAPRAGRSEEDGLWKRFRAAQDAFFARRGALFAERDAAESANKDAKLAAIAEAEALEVSDPKTAQAALRDIQERYDQIGHVPRDSMRSLDDRMRAAEARVRDAADAQWRHVGTESSPFLVQLRARLAEAEGRLAKAEASGDPDRIARARAEVESRRALLPPN
ncbi:MAG: DUF349 domain-containing protein [Frankiaceae bacterium]|jgi:hypothetical protein|nr:DUF349 domain-containing protein [Frankiaceae bacterium]